MLTITGEKLAMNDVVLFFQKMNRNKCVFCIINLALFGLVLFYNMNTGLYSDDLRCLHYWSSGSKPITSLHDAIISTNEYYMDAGGRWISYFLVQFLLVFGKNLFDVLNSIFCVLLGVIIYKYVLTENDIDNSLLLLVHILLWYYTPTWGQEFLWVSGSIMYLWTIVFALLFGYHYYLKIRMNEIKRETKPGKCIVLAVLGFLSGLSLEPTACILFIVLLIYLIVAKRREILSVSDIVGFSSFLIGFGILMLCPGNYKRAAVVSESTNIILKYGYRFFRESYYFVVYLFPLCGIAIVMYLLVHKQIKEEARFVIMFTMIALSSIYVMTFSAGFASRIFLCPTVFIIIPLGMAYTRLDCKLRGKILMGLLIIAFGAVIQGCVLSISSKGGEYPMRVDSVYISAAANM